MAINNNASNEIIDIVDAADRPIATARRQEMRTRGLLHRVTYIFVFDRRGRLLVQTRAPQKDWCPGLLDCAAGGVVLAGESYADGARRELTEELGLTTPLTAEFSLYFADAHMHSWGWVFSCQCEGPFILQAQEITRVEFLTVPQVLAIAAKQVTPDTRHALLAYLL